MWTKDSKIERAKRAHNQKGREAYDLEKFIMGGGVRSAEKYHRYFCY